MIVDCQRAGPATGMPSRTEQSRSLPRRVRRPRRLPARGARRIRRRARARGDAQGVPAFARRYQLPVLVLSDAYIAQRRQIRDVPPPRRRAVRSAGSDARRWARRASTSTGAHGVNPFRVPGTPGGTYQAAGIEHTPEGQPDRGHRACTSEMNAKRFRKLDAIAAETRDWFRTLGSRGRDARDRRVGQPVRAPARVGGGASRAPACSCPRSSTRSRSTRFAGMAAPGFARLRRGRAQLPGPAPRVPVGPHRHERRPQPRAQRRRSAHSLAELAHMLGGNRAMIKAKDYRSGLEPVWCPGCGDYGVLKGLTQALADLEIAPERLAVISGIGCSSRLPGLHADRTRSTRSTAARSRSRPGSSWRAPRSRRSWWAATATASASGSGTFRTRFGAT